MTRLTLLGLAALLAAPTSLPAQAIQPQPRTTIGIVKTIASGTVTTTDRDGKEWAFGIDAATKVIAKGASHVTAAVKAKGAVTSVADLVKEGQRIRVRYVEQDGKLRATEIRVI
jgi:hypothetical protein